MTKRLRRLAAASLTVWLVSLPAHQLVGEIAGVVTEAGTGLPLAGVRVTLNFKSTVETDERGKFVFSELIGGSYSLAFDSIGHVRPPWPLYVELAAGEKISGLTIRLERSAVISGRIADAKGRPKQAKVEVVQANIPSMVASVTSQSDGLFRITGIPAGAYRIAAQEFTSLKSQAVVTWYPGETDIGKAETVSVSAGEERKLGTISLQEVPLVTLKGYFAGQLPPERQCKVLHRSQGITPGGYLRTGQIASSGEFTYDIPNTPVAVMVECFSTKGQQPLVAGYRNFNPGDDAGEFVIPASVIRTVRATFRWIDGRAQPIRAMFALNPTRRLGIMQFGKPVDGGAIDAPEVSPDVYSIMPSKLPAGAYVQTILAGKVDITTSGLDLVNGGATELEIVLASNGATVSGVVSGLGAPQTGSVQVNRKSENPHAHWLWSRSASCDSKGRFRVDGLAPGEYTLRARGEFRTSENIDIRVKSGERAVVDLVVP